MPFPISIAGSIRLPKPATEGDHVERALVRIADMLDAAAANTVTRAGTTVRFRAGLLRWVWSASILVCLDSGTIEVADAATDLRISYRASTLELMILVRDRKSVV